MGNFLLHKLSPLIDTNDIGLYRDDGLGVLRNLSGPQSERRRKDIIKVFKELSLSIIIKCRLKKVNFLDVTFDIENNTYEPYRKPNDTPLFINIGSNHPKCIKNKIAKSVQDRLSNISCNENVFNKHKNIYENSLRNSGFNENLVYNNTETREENNTRKQRKRKIIWFNPPFSTTVKTKIGKIFLELLDKHFPRSSEFHKIFNRNTVKISYSCTKNMASTISAHNRKILKPIDEDFGCNCRSNRICPLDGKCLTPNTVYLAEITNNTNTEKRFYIGISATPFKERARNHNRDITHDKYKNSTELAKYVWKLRDKGITANVKYKTLRKIYGRPKEKFCQLCLTEKLLIFDFEYPDMLLNDRSELFKKCRHTNKFLVTRDSMD